MAALILTFASLAIAQTATLEAPAPVVTESASLANANVCINLTNECGTPYGGCYTPTSGSPAPTYTPPPCPSAAATETSSASSSAITLAPTLIWPSNSYGNGSCQQAICIDYINNCDIKYGGCFPICEGQTTPAFVDPGCPTGSFSSYSKSFITTRTTNCGNKCDLYTDGCGNTFGPGCYTSCSGEAPPTYTTPFCETSVAVTAAEATPTEVGPVESS